jgi:hypothetical protein
MAGWMSSDGVRDRGCVRDSDRDGVRGGNSCNNSGGYRRTHVR